MVLYFNQLRALCISDITSHQQHNLYTPRGAQVRDALAWSEQILESIDRFGDRLEVQFASHHWPTWGRAAVVSYLELQRDLYKFIHDQSLRLANLGFNMDEIAEQLELPEELAREFSCRGYYGTLNHGAKAVYVKYLGHFDGNPANLHPHPPVAAAKRYLEFMGGADAIVTKARTNFEEGDYRWVAQVLNQGVIAEPQHAGARALLADTFEQLGYQSESAVWRNFYLCGALELRHGTPASSPNWIPPATADNMPLEDVFKAMAVRLNPQRSQGLTLRFALRFSDLDQSWSLIIQRSILHACRSDQMDGQIGGQVTTIDCHSQDFKRVLLGLAPAPDLIQRGELRITGDSSALATLGGLFDSFERRFPIVTPRTMPG
ncbi:MAG: hypothetical protein FJ194_02850 [Gammaproteobacteria bacterium]|nr:hypothetical protein [Gammaproteobacteria bacterium]